MMQGVVEEQQEEQLYKVGQLTSHLVLPFAGAPGGHEIQVEHHSKVTPHVEEGET